MLLYANQWSAVYLSAVTVTVSNAQLQNLALSPVTLIEAPGEGKMIVPSTITMHYRGTTMFGGDNGGYTGSVGVVFGGSRHQTNGGYLSISPNVSLTSVTPPADWLWLGKTLNIASDGVSGYIVNQPVVLCLNDLNYDADGIPSGFEGQIFDYRDGDGLLKFSMSYNVVDINNS